MGELKIIVLFFVLALTMASGAHSQPSHTIEVSGTLGLALFEKELQFESRPTFGLGAGYDIRDWLQLNLALSATPTRQRVPTATTTVTANYSVYTYHLNLRFAKPAPLLWRLRPFGEIGIGGLTIDPGAVTLDLGAGQLTTFEAPASHHGSIRFGVGIALRLSRHLALRLAYRHLLYRLEMQTESETETITAQNRIFGVNLSTSF